MTAEAITQSREQATSGITAEARANALAFEAPYLTEKLLKDHVVDTSSEAEALFREVKRYLVLTASDPSVAWGMYSLRVDQVWHQFILFTRQYIEYCRSHFGKYVQHAPSTAPAVVGLPETTPSTLAMFEERYELLFGEPLPDLWYDERNVTLGRRIVNPGLDVFHVHAGEDMVELLNQDGEPVFGVDPSARSALEFIARNGTFFVRELPSDLGDDQKVALVSTLVEFRLLKLAS